MTHGRAVSAKKGIQVVFQVLALLVDVFGPILLNTIS
jgi:hypothetical protein